MARPGSRQQLIDYCLRALGEPVLEVNVDPDQIEDRVDQALQYFRNYHSDGSQRLYYSYQITADDVSNKSVQLDDSILSVQQVLPLGDLANTSFNLFDVTYQLMFDLVNRGFSAGDMSYYEQMQQHLSLLSMKLNGTVQTGYSRYRNELKLYGEFANDLEAGDWIVIECIAEIPEPSDAVSISTSIYDNLFIKEYTTALIKQQWGANLIKFEGMQLPGGITLNGRQLFEDAMQDIERLQERLRLEFEEPVDFFVG